MKLRHTENPPLAIFALIAGVLALAGCSSTATSTAQHTAGGVAQHTAGCTGARRKKQRPQGNLLRRRHETEGWLDRHR